VPGWGAGKTSLAEALVRGRPAGSAAIVHQDDFFTTTLDDPTDYGPDRPNLETPGGIDWGRLLAAIADARQEAGPGGLVVVEGFLLLAAGEDGSSALPLFDAIFFLEADEAECLRRRLARNPDRTAQQAEGLRGYWKRCTWPGYLEHTAPVLARLRAAGDERLRVIDATVGQDAVEAQLLAAAAAHPRLQHRPPRL